MACQILVLRPGIEHRPPALAAPRPHCRTAREVPEIDFNDISYGTQFTQTVINILKLSP